MIHKFMFDDTRLVLDVHSGSLHVMDQLAWEMLDYFYEPEQRLAARFKGRYPAGEITGAIEEIRELADNQLLFSEDPLGGRYNPPEDNTIKALCLHLAHDCNLACRYCFAGQGQFGGPRGLMSPEAGRRALEFLMDASGQKRNLNVDFFGGEPLLNFNVLRMLVDYGRELARERGKQIKFTVTTNAVLLDRKVGEYLANNGLSVILSLDGRPGVHDKMRPFPGGAGSYDLVLGNIQHFLQSTGHQDYYIRGTYTADNLDFAGDVEHLISRGFTNISLEPVVAGPEESYALSDEMLGTAVLQYEELTRLILRLWEEGRDINFFHFNIDLEGGPCLPKRMSGCGAGHQYLAVDPEGVLYPCHQFVGREEFVVGDVFTGINRPELMQAFKTTHLYHKEGCGECWAKYFCSGGCHANAYIYNGSLKKPYQPACVLTKKRLECALYLYYRKNTAASCKS